MEESRSTENPCASPPAFGAAALSPAPPARIHFMDEVRGGDILLMVFYHAFYTAGFIYGLTWGQKLLLFFMPSEAFFAGIFIFISGISSRLSHSNLRRGLGLLGVALGITLALWIFMPEEIIVFGILHFLAVSILLFAVLRPLLDRVPPWAGLAACALLMLATWWVPPYNGGMFGIRGLLTVPVPECLSSRVWLFPLGFHFVDSADYFPLLPWVFCFLGGSFAGVWARQGRFPRWMYRRRAPFLSKVGKHTLWIYVLHQPVIYGVFYLVFAVKRALGL